MSARTDRPHRRPAYTTTCAVVALPAAVQGPLSVPASPGPVVGSLCTGCGGLDLGVLAALGGGRIAWCADPDPHIARILAVRMPGVPNLGDLRGIDWTTVEPVEVLTAGFPCQDISAAGRRAGIEKGTRSGLWTDIVEGLRLLRPALLVVENVAALRWRAGGLHRVLGDLAEAGYDALWRSVRAADIGAAHRRERVFLLGWLRHHSAGADAAYADRARRFLQRHLSAQPARWSSTAGPAALAAHTDRLRRQELHPPHPDRGTIPARPGPAAADAEDIRHRHAGPPRRDGLPAAAIPAGPSARRPRDVAADTASDRRDQGLPGTAGLQRRPDAALSDHAPEHPSHRHLNVVADTTDPQTIPAALTRSPARWGPYTTAVQRWEHLLGRRAPAATQPGTHSRPVLAPAFVEWLQGLEPGWVTDLPLPRTAQLRALGNGVVPQQAAHAIGLLLADLAALLNERLDNRREVDAA